MDRLKNKICIVTGAASGIGWETACMFQKEGAQVHALDVDTQGLEQLKELRSEIHTHTVDVTDSDQIKRLLENVSSVDVLFNCAGRVDVGSVLECSEEDWDRSYNLNVGSLFRLSQAVLPKMLEQNSGSIINMASVISSMGGAPDRFVYGVTKGAVIGMTKSIAKDFAKDGIRCNAICPSAVETPTMKRRIEAMDDPQSARQMFSQRQPVGRMGTTEEIAYLAVYLASDESKFVTGSAMVIDGGAKI
jgi:NAD(P)-dependent dehydrogenase (short-subunit alcohol dehydrogenase family)